MYKVFCFSSISSCESVFMVVDIGFLKRLMSILILSLSQVLLWLSHRCRLLLRMCCISIPTAEDPNVLKISITNCDLLSVLEHQSLASTVCLNKILSASLSIWAWLIWVDEDKVSSEKYLLFFFVFQQVFFFFSSFFPSISIYMESKCQILISPLQPGTELLNFPLTGEATYNDSVRNLPYNLPNRYLNGCHRVLVRKYV